MGFSDLVNLRKRLENAAELIPTVIGDAVVDYREEIADLNREQLEKGETPNATPIRPAYRNPQYARMKHARNPKPPLNTPDLINTEEYVRSIRVDVYADGFELRATDKKAGQIAAKYGAVIGLSNYSKNRLAREAVLPYMLRHFKLLLK
jgi:hypothetical protein